MAKTTTDTHNAKDSRIVDLQNKVVGLQRDLADKASELKKSLEASSRYKTAAENAKLKSKTAIASAEVHVQELFAGLGPSVIVKLNKPSKAGDGTEMLPGTVIGVLHINGKLNADYLVSAIQTGRAKVVPGETEGSFQFGDIEELRKAKAKLDEISDEDGELITQDTVDALRNENTHQAEELGKQEKLIKDLQKELDKKGGES